MPTSLAVGSASIVRHNPSSTASVKAAVYASSAVDKERGVPTKYHLMSSTQHDGQPDSGTYRTFVHFKANDQWYEMQDLHVNGVHPQLISVSESYIQFYDSSTT